MKRRLRVLVVMSDTETASTTRNWVEARGYDTGVCPGFMAACTELERTPDLVIAELRLGAFNGLHVAMRALWDGIPAIVLGPDDPVLRKEARAMGISYVTPDVNEQALAALVDSLVTLRLQRTATADWMSEDETLPTEHHAAVA